MSLKEIMVILLALMVLHPTAVSLNRGNHEVSIQQQSEWKFGNTKKSPKNF
jgi:hypothetical protein